MAVQTWTVHSFLAYLLRLSAIGKCDLGARWMASKLLESQTETQRMKTLNDSQRPHPAESVPQLIEEQAAARPNEVAVASQTRLLTYRELNDRATQLAERLRAMGVGPEVLVGLCFERSLAMVVGALAVLK